MNQLVKRIVRNGLLAAAILGVVGLGFAEAASLWMSSQAGRGAIGEAATSQSLRYRLPLGMAGWGFLFVVLTEVGLYLWRGDRAQPVAKESTPEPPHDPASILIEQILREAELNQRPPATDPSPSPPVRENSPVHQSSPPG